MKPLDLTDIRPPRLYERARDAARRRIIELKRPRRHALGPDATVVFENRATMIFQVEEMARAEHLEDPVKIQHEIEVYNSLLPAAGELAATLFVEVIDPGAIRDLLQRMVGIDEHVALDIGGVRVAADFEPGRREEARISSVQYLRFRLPPAAIERLQVAGTRVSLECDLPGYVHATALSEEARVSLAGDLA